VKKEERKKYNLEERLIDYSAQTISFAKQMEKDYISNYLYGQFVRSGLSTALNFAEGQSAESQKDYIHKMKIALKELRETRMSLRIIERTDLVQNKKPLQELLQENNELISIFVKSVSTASERLNVFKK
jgi:four helix bundle protein